MHIRSGNLAEIVSLVVTETFRGKGLGRDLVAKAETWAAARGLAKLRGRSQILRERAKRFYTGMGFSVTKEQRVLDKEI